MVFRLLADATVVFHLAFIGFVLFGGFFVLRRPWLAWVHLPAAAWGALVEFAGWICPLTPLENWLREEAGGPAYTSSFVEEYILPLLYPDALSRELQWALGAVVVVMNVAVYSVVLRQRSRLHARVHRL